MPMDHRERLASIRRFDQLIAYLRDELDWPIGADSFEDLTFEYEAEELGIDQKNAAKIQEIKRLRPLVPGQPWGIFFVKFEPKRLPVVALRRILGQVALKKRASAVRSDRRAWAVDDLLFVSNYGEGEKRHIAFAHFSKPEDTRDLPTLKVLGWDNLDTPLHLDAIARELTEHLTWPDDDDDTDAWRERWRSAFKLRHRETITTSKQLSERLAELARATRDRIRTALAIETESGPLTQLMKAFQTSLVHDLDEADFADMYAQTIAYGLLSARITDPTRRTADDLAAHMRTNPFLKELMETFLNVGGRRSEGGGSGIDFDELGVSEVVELLDEAKMEAVVRDFGDQNPQEDPVIHFYEHFLAAYDNEKRISRGVFYTPRPVVSYIVNSVDELLRTDFGLADGLADTGTWDEVVQRQKDLKIPEGISPTQAFVQILDPATGTGTFLVEIIDVIHRTMIDKWKNRGHGGRKIQALWNDYVPKHLLPRLHGYELLMAPYAIAHLKIGLKLLETGYRFENDERARVYLTNALEPAGDDQLPLDILPALAHEAEAVNEIKREQRFTVVIGNPPYSGLSSNKGAWIDGLLKGRLPDGTSTRSYYHIDGKPLGERKLWLQDDYVKFIRLSQWLLDGTGVGIHGYISNHGYLDNPTFRGMRWSLMQSFRQIRVLDLHGSLKKQEVRPDGGRDDNVFDIQQGVAVGLFTKAAGTRSVCHADLWGERQSKYDCLLKHSTLNAKWMRLEPTSRFYLFEPFEGVDTDGYSDWSSIKDVMSVNVTGIVTARDGFVIDLDRDALRGRIVDLRSESLSDEAIRKKYFGGKGSKKYPPGDSRGWKLPAARQKIREDARWDERYAHVLYRPFDIREIYYVPWMVDWPRTDAMPHLLAGENVALIACRQQARDDDEWAQVFTTSRIAESCAISNVTREINYIFPLYLYPGVDKADGSLFSRWAKGKDGRTPNLASGFVQEITAATKLRFVSDGCGDLRKNFGPEDVLAWIYAVFHSSRYRERYEAQLKLDFPRVPLPGNAEIFRELAVIGRGLQAIHLLESPLSGKPTAVQTGTANPEVGRVGWSGGTVWLDAGKTNARERHRATEPGTMGFKGVSEEVWDFQIGGYQVCHKWLKDRKGRTLSNEDVAHYQKMVVAVSETIRSMAAIDEIIDAHGGWPHAFETKSEAVPASGGTAKVVPFRPHAVEPAPRDRYVTCLPLVPLKAAAGEFSEAQYIQDDDFEWVAVDSQHRLRKGMFVAQVTGKSMEPAVQDGAWCVFRGPVEGTRQGKIVLVQLRDATDPETGQRYTVKRYASEKVKEEDSWRHVKITLKPANPDFEPIVLSGADEDELQVIAELVEVLEG